MNRKGLNIVHLCSQCDKIRVHDFGDEGEGPRRPEIKLNNLHRIFFREKLNVEWACGVTQERAVTRFLVTVPTPVSNFDTKIYQIF